MKEIVDRLSSYNIFNYLFPGVVFAAMATSLTGYSLIQRDWIVGLFLYYFIGLVVSRFGSLAVEPFLKWVRLLSFAEYKDFVHASKNDPKIELLSEVNNTYRTLVATFALLALLMGYEKLEARLPWLADNQAWISLLALLLLFLLSYRKQTEYVKKRVAAWSKEQ